MKKFTVPCDFGGTKAPFDVYIGNPKKGNHPLQNQASWLSSERGGTIPAEVMESFSKLLDLAEQNGVSFQDLCVYALETANEGGVKAAGDAAAPPSSPPKTPNDPPEQNQMKVATKKVPASEAKSADGSPVEGQDQTKSD